MKKIIIYVIAWLCLILFAFLFKDTLTKNKTKSAPEVQNEDLKLETKESHPKITGEKAVGADQNTTDSAQ